MTLILASQSASRKAMLEAAGVPFEARSGDVDEGAIKRELIGVPPADIAMILAEAKALADELAAEEARIAEEEEALALAAAEEEEAAALAEAAAELELAAGEVEMQEGETLDELKARMQAMKPKKPTFTADMLDTANSYDDKVALIRMLVSQESGRVALVLKNMVRS